jgi:transcriptional regulator with XRE-family HTH domain
MHRFDIRRLRRENNLTQIELAKLTGYPQGFISQMENGKGSIPASFIKILMEKLNVTNLSAYIVSEEETKPTKEMKDFAFGRNAKWQNGLFDATILRLLDMLERRDARIEEKDAEIKKLRKLIDDLEREIKSLQLTGNDIPCAKP